MTSDSIAEQAAHVLAGGADRFYEYPHTGLDRERFRQQARALAAAGLLRNEAPAAESDVDLAALLATPLGDGSCPGIGIQATATEDEAAEA